jgi:hypothetical protein
VAALGGEPQDSYQGADFCVCFSIPRGHVQGEADDSINRLTEQDGILSKYGCIVWFPF